MYHYRIIFLSLNFSRDSQKARRNTKRLKRLVKDHSLNEGGIFFTFLFYTQAWKLQRILNKLLIVFNFFT